MPESLETRFKKILEGILLNIANDAHDQTLVNFKKLPGQVELSQEDIEALVYNRLRSLENGDFQTCNLCGSLIDESRLQEFPLSGRCSECQPDKGITTKKPLKWTDFLKPSAEKATARISEGDMIDLQTFHENSVKIIEETLDGGLLPSGPNYEFWSKVASFAAKEIEHHLRDSSSFPLHWLQNKSGNKYINHNHLELGRIYPNEILIANNLPYTELADFTEEIRIGKEIKIAININNDAFQLNGWNQPSASELVEQGYQSFRADGRATHNSATIRFSGIEKDQHSTVFFIQKAQYYDQVRSNLILDLEDENRDSLRNILQSENYGSLPDLDDPRLANTLGVAVMVFYEHHGAIRPILVPRTNKVAIFNEGSWHCTASGAAEWPSKFLDVMPDSYAYYILDDLYRELQEEVGLTRQDLPNGTQLVAVCRELARGGKPQLFFIAFTDLSEKEIYHRIESARLKADKRIEPTEINQMPRVFEPHRPQNAEELQNFFRKGGLTHEAAALMHYYFKCKLHFQS